MLQKTLIIIKPDSVAGGKIGKILSVFEDNNLKISALKMTKMSKELAEFFYWVHRDKPFFEELTSWMSSCPVVVAVIEGVNALSKVAELVGATDPAEAKPGTIRAMFGSSVGCNAIHRSDSEESAKREIGIFFPELY
jgi:nucleoside-diphosphate kinase